MRLPGTRMCFWAAKLLPVTLLMASASALPDDSSFTSTAGLGSKSGAEIYGQICQGCHMADGQGASGAGHYPALAANPNLAPWQYVALTVLQGRHGMPPFGLPADQVSETRTVHLSDAQIADVVNFVRSHFGNGYNDPVTAVQIGTLPHPGSKPGS